MLCKNFCCLTGLVSQARYWQQQEQQYSLWYTHQNHCQIRMPCDRPDCETSCICCHRIILMNQQQILPVNEQRVLIQHACRCQRQQ